MALLISKVAPKMKGEKIEKRGPLFSLAHSGEDWNQVGLGFFLKHEVQVIPTVEQARKRQHAFIVVREFKGREYLFFRNTPYKERSYELLIENLPQLILSCSFPKQMRWNSAQIRFARPIRWILALLGKNIIPFQLGELTSGNHSLGHAQLSPHLIQIDHPQHYLSQLRAHHVEPQIEGRRREIDRQLGKIEEDYQATARERERLIEENVHLTEWPTLLVGHFEEKFLKMPPEILLSEMIEHQRYFPLVANSGGALLPYFVLISNNGERKSIRQGHERALSARLTDGLFLYEKDCARKREELREELHQMTYLRDHGSMLDKQNRLESYAPLLHSLLPVGDLPALQRAAGQCKEDLASEVVREFPHLQGVMGGHYALARGEEAKVARAIREHWQPRREGDLLPTSSEGTLLAISDKIDHLLCCFLAGLQPRSSGDPYAVRRAALGVIRLLLHLEHSFSLREILSLCLREIQSFSSLSEEKRQTLLGKLLSFIEQRAHFFFLERGFTRGELSLFSSLLKEDLYEGCLQLSALGKFRQEPFHDELIELYKRIRGQVQKRANREALSPVQEKLLQTRAERSLYTSLLQVRRALEKSRKARAYAERYSLLHSLQKKVTRFFSSVQILCDEKALRTNRLALLNQLLSLFDQVVDFSQLL